jgi:FG-GAP-like repeat
MKKLRHRVGASLLLIVLSGLSTQELCAQSFTVAPVTVSFPASISTGVAVGDFNGDGKPDLAVVSSCPTRFNGGCSSDIVTILLGNGDGTFRVGNAYSTGGLDPSGVVIGDFNGDGKLDLAISNDNGAIQMRISRRT